VSTSMGEARACVVNVRAAGCRHKWRKSVYVEEKEEMTEGGHEEAAMRSIAKLRWSRKWCRVRGSG
jgi:hypothetical protein